jgi:hypothetical protein
VRLAIALAVATALFCAAIWLAMRPCTPGDPGIRIDSLLLAGC